MKTCEAKMCIVASESGLASQNALSTLLTKVSLHIKTYKKHHLVIRTPNIPSLTNHLLLLLHIWYLTTSHGESTWGWHGFTELRTCSEPAPRMCYDSEPPFLPKLHDPDILEAV